MTESSFFSLNPSQIRIYLGKVDWSAQFVRGGPLSIGHSGAPSTAYLDSGCDNLHTCPPSYFPKKLLLVIHKRFKMGHFGVAILSLSPYLQGGYLIPPPNGNDRCALMHGNLHMKLF